MSTINKYNHFKYIIINTRNISI